MIILKPSSLLQLHHKKEIYQQEIKVNIREKVGYVMLDQIKTVDKLRLQGKPIGKMKSEQITELKKPSLKC